MNSSDLKCEMSVIPNMVKEVNYEYIEQNLNKKVF